MSKKMSAGQSAQAEAAAFALGIVDGPVLQAFTTGVSDGFAQGFELDTGMSYDDSDEASFGPAETRQWAYDTGAWLGACLAVRPNPMRVLSGASEITDTLTQRINVVAEPEGWAIFNGVAIQRDDDSNVFPGDADAIAHVARLSDGGSFLHKAALDVHLTHFELAGDRSIRRADEDEEEADAAA